MQKQQIIELIQRAISGGDAPADLKGRFHPKEIELYVALAFEALFNGYQSDRNEMAAQMGLDAWKYDKLTKSYKLDIEFDNDTEKFYSTLPINILSIVDNTGIRLIHPLKEETTAFFPRHQTDAFLMNGLDVNQFSNMVYYYLEGKTIWYTGSLDCNWKQVRAKLVLKFSEFDDTDDISLPDGKFPILMQMVMQMMQQKNPSDLIDDTTPIQNTK